MRQTLVLGFLVCVLLAACASPTKQVAAPGLDGWDLVWSDEFDASVLDSKKWAYDLGSGIDGWGNRELQVYTNLPKNVFLENGYLHIRAQREDREGQVSYSSGRIKTENLAKFRFGRIEARIKMPYGQSLLPAFWMLGQNFATESWPYSGEIDIAEMVGGPAAYARGDSVVHGTAHFFNEDKGAKESSSNHSTLSKKRLADEFHTYAVEWSPEKIVWFFDQTKYHELALSKNYLKEFQRSFFILLNLAVGGNWPGSPDESTVFPQTMIIDYVRVYKAEASANFAPEQPLLEGEKPRRIAFDQGFKPGFAKFLNGSVIRYGGLNLPTVLPTADAGLVAMSAEYPGGDWGGFYYQLSQPLDATEYKNGYLSFHVKLPSSMTDFELKLESQSGSTSRYLSQYAFESQLDGFRQYRIPLADFPGVDFGRLTIPFSCWNPKNNAESGSGIVLFRDVEFVKP